MSPSFLETGSRLRPLETWAISSGEGRVIQRKELKTQRAEGRAKTHREPSSVAGLTTCERLDLRIVVDP